MGNAGINSEGTVDTMKADRMYFVYTSRREVSLSYVVRGVCSAPLERICISISRTFFVSFVIVG